MDLVIFVIPPEKLLQFDAIILAGMPFDDDKNAQIKLRFLNALFSFIIRIQKIFLNWFLVSPYFWIFSIL